ncbi:serine/threonine protein kinase, putative [Plasmodium gallinaceum]|uniref:non-specific serine/threonine protein kinase n=1 Tax=Plasmodium gallinaceum TaxID=5849 RepID=A0A1J1H1B9_PLAGA|nr:serine/threonine protein kinase, putative [Plasmodium gallinaceum]CRG97101.1 serine/threonine protein kinase, putative [Plasmodium gallinaceum]
MLKFRSICTTLIGGKIYNINGKTIREEKLISEGAYSFVYMAKDLNTNKIFTLKKTICQDKEKFEMANKEINILKSLPPHKNIVQYYGSTVVSENNYKIVIMLMEYCERGNLLNIFEKNKDKLREHHIVKIMKDIITGLCFLHTQEIPIIHRDIKLENILCDKKGVYKICDFGSHTVSKSIYPNDLMKNSLYILKEEIERDTTLMYRPPELIDLYSNLEISCKVDMWMLGCILYLLLFKVHPFQNNSFLSILNGSFTIPYNTKYSKRIISILLMTLNKNPLKRIDSSTLLFILENYADLKKWFTHIPSDIKKRVNQIFDKMNELNLNNKQNNLIEINNDKIIEIKTTQKCETQIPKNNINFLKFFSQNNLNSNTLKKNMKTNVSENNPIQNKKNDIIEEKKENDTTTNNIKDNKDVLICTENKILEENTESKIENKNEDPKIKSTEKIISQSDNNINESGEDLNLLNLSIEPNKTMGNDDNQIIYNDNEHILKDLSLNNELNLFDFKNSILSNEKSSCNNFDNFFDPWNYGENDDLSKICNSANKNNDNDLFESNNNFPINNDLFNKDENYSRNSDFFKDNKNEIFKDTYFSINNLSNDTEKLKDQNFMNIHNTCNNMYYFEEMNDHNFDSMLKTKIEINSEFNSKNNISNNRKTKNTSQLITPDKNDKFSELLDEFQNLSVQ